MASPSSAFQLLKAYFHNLSKVAMFDTQATYESTIKNGHRIQSTEVWSDNISFCVNETESDIFVVNNPTVAKKHTMVDLVAVDGTNNQLYRVIQNNTWINQWISPTDSINDLGETSQGFACKLYQNNGTLISLTDGVHIRNYFNGLIEFQVGYTPINLGYQLPLKITFYEYIGKTLADVDVNSKIEIKERFTVVDNTMEYTLAHIPINDSEKVVVQGMFLDSGDDYTITGNKITFKETTLEVGKKIIIIYSYRSVK